MRTAPACAGGARPCSNVAIHRTPLHHPAFQIERMIVIAATIADGDVVVVAVAVVVVVVAVACPGLHFPRHACPHPTQCRRHPLSFSSVAVTSRPPHPAASSTSPAAPVPSPANTGQRTRTRRPRQEAAAPPWCLVAAA